MTAKRLSSWYLIRFRGGSTVLLASLVASSTITALSLVLHYSRSSNGLMASSIKRWPPLLPNRRQIIVKMEKAMAIQSTPVTSSTISQMTNSWTKTSECAPCQAVPLAATEQMTTRVITPSTTSWAAVSMTLTTKRNLTLTCSTTSMQNVRWPRRENKR